MRNAQHMVVTLIIIGAFAVTGLAAALAQGQMTSTQTTDDLAVVVGAVERPASLLAVSDGFSWMKPQPASVLMAGFGGLFLVVGWRRAVRCEVDAVALKG